jgi:uncharacterized protein (TIRG00374 family)
MLGISTLRRSLQWGLRKKWPFHLILTAGFVALALGRVDLGQVAEPLREANYGWAALAFLIATLARVLQALRWRLYLAKVGRIPLPSLLGAILIGNMGNNLVPMRAGDVARIQILANRFGISRAGLAATVFVVEGILDGVVFLVLLLLGLAFLDVGFVPPAILWSLAITAGGGFLVTVLVSRFLPADPAAWPWLRRLPARPRDVLSQVWPPFLAGLETMRNGRLLAATLSLNFVDWLAQVAVFAIFGLAFGLDLSFGSYVVIMIAANLIVAVPITFQNIGTFEVALLEIMVALGVAREEAFAYVAATHMLTNLWIVITGLVAVWLMRISPRDVFALRRAKEPEEAPLARPLPPLPT